MKLTLIHGKYSNSWECLAHGYLAAYIRQHEPDCEITYWQGCFDTDSEMIADSITADIVAFSNTSPTYKHSVELARAIKKENSHVWTTMGGYHPSAVKEKALVPGVIDQCVVGEGEDALLKIVRGDRRPLIFGRKMDFHELPKPDRAIIKSERCVSLAEEITSVRMTSFITHKGCPYTCSYCLDGKFKALYPNMSWKGKDLVRYRDIDESLDELEQITEFYNLGLAKIADATWNVGGPWCLEWCKRKVARGIKVPFYPMIHAGMLTEELAYAMAEANCVQTAIGCESGSDKILDKIGKGTRVKSIRRCFKYLKAAGIQQRAFFILGVEGENYEDIKLTEQLADELEADMVGFSVLCPYPGTAQYSEERFGDTDWSTCDEYSSPLWSNEYLTNEELRAEQTRLAQKFSKTLNWHQQSLLQEEGRLEQQAPRAFKLESAQAT